MLTYDPSMMDEPARARLELPRAFVLAGGLYHLDGCRRIGGPSASTSMSLLELAAVTALHNRGLCYECGSALRRLGVSEVQRLTQIARLLHQLKADTNVHAGAATEELLTDPSFTSSTLKAFVPALEETLTDRNQRARAWLASTIADEVLEIYATMSEHRRMRHLRTLVANLAHEVSTSSDVFTVVGREAPSGLPRIEGLTRLHRDRDRRPGRILVHVPGGTVHLVGRNLLAEKLEERTLGAVPGVLLLPRSLEALRLEPYAAPSRAVTSAVVRDSDSTTVLETAARLLGDGGVSPAGALKLARAL